MKWNENVENLFLFGKNRSLGKTFVHFTVTVVKAIASSSSKSSNNNLSMYKLARSF